MCLSSLSLNSNFKTGRSNTQKQQEFLKIRRMSRYGYRAWDWYLTPAMILRPNQLLLHLRRYHLTCCDRSKLPAFHLEPHCLHLSRRYNKTSTHRSGLRRLNFAGLRLRSVSCRCHQNRNNPSRLSSYRRPTATGVTS